MNKALLVVGMHRSGTSALTGALSILGVDIGTELLPAKSDENAKGFFELKEVHSFHERLLLSGGRTWDTPWPVTSSWLDRIATPSAKAELRGILERNFADSDLWTVKDPRLCHLLPLWREVLTDLAVDAAVIHIVREPAAVAASLAKRNGFTNDKSGLLWLEHNLAAEREGRGLQRAFLTYEDLIATKMGALEPLATELGVKWPNGEEETAADVETFLTRKLDHSSNRPSGQNREFDQGSDIVSGLDRLLRDLAATGEAGDEAWQAFDQVREQQNVLVAGFDRILLDHCTDLVLGTDGLRELQLTLDAVQKELDKADVYTKHVERNLGSAQSQAASTREFIASLEKAIDKHRLHEDEVNSYAKSLETNLQEKDTQIRAFEDKIAKQAGLTTEHEQVLQEAARYTRSLESELEKHQNQQKELAQYIQKLLSELEKHQNLQGHAGDPMQGHDDQRESQKPIEPEKGHD